MEYMNEDQLQSEMDAEAMARAMEEEAFMRAFAKTRGQPEPATPTLAARPEPAPVLRQEQPVEAPKERVFKQRNNPASVRKQAEREAESMHGEVNKQVAKGDQGGSGRTKDAPRPKGAKGDAPDSVKINKGDTLWALAKKYGVSVDDLIAMNGGVDPRKLQIGQDIRLRPQEAPAAQAPADEGPSLLARKIQAERAKPAPTAFSAFRDVNINNKFNGNLRESRDAAMNYLSAAAMGGASGNSLGRLLRMEAEGKFKQPPRLKRPNW